MQTEDLLGNAGLEPAVDMDPELVADYLAENPQFFLKYADLLDHMELPSHDTKAGVVDFQRYQLERRNSEIDELRSCAQDVIETSRNNMSVQTRTHAAVLAILHATTPDQLFRIVGEDLPVLLDVDVAVVGFEPASRPHRSDHEWQSTYIATWHGRQHRRR